MSWLPRKFKKNGNIRDLRRISPADQLCIECRVFAGKTNYVYIERGF